MTEDQKMDKPTKIANEFQPQLTQYWEGVSLDDIVKIKTKAFDSHYVHRDAEEFMALRLPAREIPGVGPRDLRIIRLDKSADILILWETWVESIDGKPYAIPTEWKVSGSKGKTYTVSRNGTRFHCTCPGFKYRHKCKHSAEKQEQYG